MNNFYTYVHIDRETQTPFYIGIGQGKRAYDKSRNEFWKSFVNEHSRDYEVKFIAENIDEDTAREIEHLLIGKFGKIQTGNGILLNWTDGGFGEGVFFQLTIEDNLDLLISKMNDYGKLLYSNSLDQLNRDKIHKFLDKTINDKSEELRNKHLFEISKSVKPRNSWVIPFCLTESVKQNDTLNLQMTELESLKSIINSPIKIEKLPVREHTEFFIHRLMIYFDLILQQNISLMKNGKVISIADADWYFYKEYWLGYIKLIQTRNHGFEFEVNYIGRNKRENTKLNIHDFEINIKK